MRRWIALLHRDERAQDAFEYLLVTGTVVVAMALAFFGFTEIIPDIVGHTCPGIDTAAAAPPSPGSCLTEGP